MTIYTLNELKEKRRKKKRNAIALLVNALVDFFIYLTMEETIYKLVVTAAIEAEDLSAVFASGETTEAIMTFIIIVGLCELVFSIIFFVQLSDMDAKIARGEYELKQKQEEKMQLLAVKYEQNQIEAASKDAETTQIGDIIYCPQCARRLPSKAFYCATCGCKQK